MYTIVMCLTVVGMLFAAFLLVAYNPVYIAVLLAVIPVAILIGWHAGGE